MYGVKYALMEKDGRTVVRRGTFHGQLSVHQSARWCSALLQLSQTGGETTLTRHGGAAQPRAGARVVSAARYGGQ